MSPSRAGGDLVLAITSSTAVVGVAIVRGEIVLSNKHVVTDRRHAEELTPMIRTALIEAGSSVGDVDRIAVDIGPGRFTGMRVGLTTARALAFAVEKPVVGISSLELLAEDAADVGGPVWAVIDARRNEVFQQRYCDGRSDGAAMVGPADELARLIRLGDTVVGDGADRYPGVYTANTHISGRSPSAVTLARLAQTRPAGPGRDVEPLYLRDADVQINIKTRHNT